MDANNLIADGGSVKTIPSCCNILVLKKYHQRAAIRKWRTSVQENQRREESKCLLEAAASYYKRNFLRLVLLSWNAWPALAERRAVKFWKATHVRRLLWRWFSFAFNPAVREIRLVRMLRCSKGYSIGSWKENSNLRNSFSSSHKTWNQECDDFQDIDISSMRSSAAAPQPRSSSPLRPIEKPILEKKNSYAELHSVMTEIKTLDRRRAYTSTTKKG